jgi:hemolysin III
MPPQAIHPFLLRHPVSAATHLFWCLWSAYAAALLWRLARGDRLRQWSVGCFGASMVLLYAASGAYHAAPASAPRLVDTLRRLDHSAIYLLIAGTYTPIFGVLLTGRLRAFLLALMWALAAAGIACKWVLPFHPHSLTIALYLGMGWIGLVPVRQITRAVGPCGAAWGYLGGLLYTAGAACEAAGWPVLWAGVVGPHEVLHLFDMAGTLTHVFFVARYVLPFRRGLPPAAHALFPGDALAPATS